MKQYKFKYKGRWHDILCVPCGKFKGEAIADTCFGTPDEYHFRVLESSLPKLLATLRKLNIEVAEVCDKLRWSKWNSDYAGWLSQYVVRNNVLGRYIVSIEADKFDDETFTSIVTQWSMEFEPKDHNSNTLKLLVFDNEKGIIAKMKRLCQADFNERRAR